MADTPAFRATRGLMLLASGDGPSPADLGGPKKEFRVFPMGVFRAQKFGQAPRSFVLTPENAKRIADEWAARGVAMNIDYDHNEFSGMRPEDVIAAGWGGRVEARADGLWLSDVMWTERAAGQLERKEKRYFSPTFMSDDATDPSVVTELLNVALTNLPAMHGIEPLAAKATDAPGGAEKKRMETLLTSLGLKADATEAEALSAFTKTQEKLAAVAGERDQLVALSGKGTVAEAMAYFTGLKDSHEALSARVAKTEADAKASRYEALFAKGEDEGKVTPANAEKIRKSFATPEALEAYLDVAPALPGKVKADAKEEAERPYEQLSAAEKHRLANDNPAAYAALKADFDRRRGALAELYARNTAHGVYQEG